MQERNVLVFKHEGVLAFVGRLVHDREFCEWYAAQPLQALASHGLDPHDLRDLAAILRSDRHHRDVAAALLPMVEVLLDVVEEAETGDATSRPEERLARIDSELQTARERVVVARARRPRPWWKFWS
jgi:diadenosine tetraphosphatase ApaH/serine/threonine PP2A family protein phosphatase